LSGPDRLYACVNTGASGFWLEILAGNEQGNNRRDNRERIIDCTEFPGHDLPMVSGAVSGGSEFGGVVCPAAETEIIRQRSANPRMDRAEPLVYLQFAA